MPDSGECYLSVMVVNEDHYIDKTIVTHFGDALLVHQERAYTSPIWYRP